MKVNPKPNKVSVAFSDDSHRLWTMPEEDFYEWPISERLRFLGIWHDLFARGDVEGCNKLLELVPNDIWAIGDDLFNAARVLEEAYDRWTELMDFED